ncbi:hypothetical protein [Mesorhizobium sp. B4-1-1]|uniref:hypothetical protein n=1 Tax=Mesorhizobium sp. B4-1-1 TaxID=2589890 RepID=UPI00112D6B87|nr:hypothetical protein [Mesorhizobium sp. B4-1-1]TPI13872.1 hypothetical protein FJW10_25705 [Mesorhizobium sp. B4-1-1]
MAAATHSTVPLTRKRLETIIETLISALDRFDGDPDIEDSDISEDDDREIDILDEPHDDDEMEQDILGGEHSFMAGLQPDGSGYEIGEKLLHSNIARRYGI